MLAAAYIRMGLTYDKAVIDQLVKGMQQMRDSVTYQAILEEGLARGIEEGRARGLELGREQGRVEGREEGRQEGRQEGRAAEARDMLLLAGRKRLGEPDAETLAAVTAIAEIERLENLMLRLFEVESWDELLA
jgi:predicted transposase YdaD